MLAANDRMYTIDLTQHKQREDITNKVGRMMGVTTRNFGTPIFQGPPMTVPAELNYKQDPSLFRDRVAESLRMVGLGVIKLEEDVPSAAGAGNVMKPWPDNRTPLRFDIMYSMLPSTMAVTVAISRGQAVQVHNLNGGMSWVRFEHFTLPTPYDCWCLKPHATEFRVATPSTRWTTFASCLGSPGKPA